MKKFKTDLEQIIENDFAVPVRLPKSLKSKREQFLNSIFITFRSLEYGDETLPIYAIDDDELADIVSELTNLLYCRIAKKEYLHY